MKELNFDEPDYNNLTGQEANPKETIICLRQIQNSRRSSIRYNIAHPNVEPFISYTINRKTK